MTIALTSLWEKGEKSTHIFVHTFMHKLNWNIVRKSPGNTYLGWNRDRGAGERQRASNILKNHNQLHRNSMVFIYTQMCLQLLHFKDESNNKKSWKINMKIKADITHMSNPSKTYMQKWAIKSDRCRWCI